MNTQLFMTKLGLLILLAFLTNCKTVDSTSAENLKTENSQVERKTPFAAANGEQVNKKQALISETRSDEDVWLGKYEHEELGGKELFQLEIRRTGDRLTGFYRAETTSTVFDKFSLSVQIKNDTASFYFVECLSLTKEESEEQGIDPCEDKNFQKDALMFKLVKTSAARQTVYEAKAEKYEIHGPFMKVKKFMGE